MQPQQQQYTLPPMPPSPPSTSTSPRPALTRTTTGVSNTSTLHDVALADLEKGDMKETLGLELGLKRTLSAGIVSLSGAMAPAPGLGRGLPAPDDEEDRIEEEEVAEKDARDPFCVSFGAEDKDDPLQWSDAFRWYLVFATGLLVLNATFASSAPSSNTITYIQYFNIKQIVAILPVSLFVTGYVVGPLLWGPLSETYGRRIVMLVGFSFYTFLNLGCAFAQNIETLLICRFLCGMFASSVIVVCGGLLADIWDPIRRGVAMSIFGLTPFLGPALAPMISGFLVVKGITWRALYWLLTGFAFVCLLMLIFTMPETYAPVLLKRRAERLRKETGDSRWYAPIEQHKQKTGKRVRTILGRPFMMLFREPMLASITVYMSFVYGVAYLLFSAIPIIFVKGHGFNAGQSGAMFLFQFAGGAVSNGLYVWVFNPRYAQRAAEYKQRGERPPPELRLEVGLYGGPLLVGAFFWLGWTSFPSIHWVVPALSIFLLGFSINFIFLSCLNYIVEVYLVYAASALSVNTVCRSLAGAGFPLFASQMYDALNPRWASTLLGCIALLLAPLPFLFNRYGHLLRARSKYTPGM